MKSVTLSAGMYARKNFTVLFLVDPSAHWTSLKSNLPGGNC